MNARIHNPLRLFWMWTLLGLAHLTGPWLYWLMPGKDGHDVQGYLPGRDFVNVWFGAKQVIDGKSAHILAHREYLADMRSLLGKDYPIHNFSYPPHILPLILAFGLASYFPSLAAWTLAGGAAFVLALRANKFYAFKWQALLLVLLSPAAIFNAIFGQNGAFTAAFLLGGLYLCEASPVAGGILFGLLTVKPHMGLLIPLVLLIRRNWACIASAGVTTAILIAVSLLCWGTGPWHDYIGDTIPYQAGFLNGVSNMFNPLMPGPWSDAVRMTAVEGIRYTFYGIAALAALASVILTVKKEGLTARSILMIALATMIILPYGFNYDMVAITGALAVYLGTLADVSASGFVILGCLWALPAAVIVLKLAPLPISSAILLASLIHLHFSSACGRSGTRPGKFFAPD